MYPATISLRTKINVEGTDTEKKLAGFLFDETIQVLSSFELNSIASLTYNDETCDEIFELLTEVMAHPADHSVLCVQKSLVVAKHLLIYGSERTVRSSIALTDFVRALSEFNTVLAAQQKNGVNSWWNSIKGGAVDKGFPVREAANKLLELLLNEPKVRQLRNNKADPNSLVPVGDDKVAFVSDEVRLFMLKKRMDEQNLIRVRSNLAKASGGFGAGYSSKDGKTVVGAAHSIEEMMQRAEREKKSYSDTGPIYYKPEPAKAAASPPGPAPAMDLLDFSAPAPAVVPAPVAPKPEMDLLGFGSPAVPAPAAPVDPFAPVAVANQDFLGASLATPASTSATQQSDLLGVSSSVVTPVTQQSDLLGVAASAAVPSMNMSSTVDAFAGLTMDPAATTAPLPPNPLGSAPSLPTKKPAGNGLMSAPVVVVEDRFAALDALEVPKSAKTAGTILTGLEAQNRILSFSEISANEIKKEEPSLVPETQQPPPPDLPPPDLPSPEIQPPQELPPMPSDFPPSLPDHSYGSATMNTPVQGTMSGMTMMSMMSGVNGLGGAPAPAPMPDLPPMPPPQPPADDLPAMSVAEKFGNYNYDDDDDNGFVMGGTAGSGLQPTAVMPPQPPPPPPPTMY